MEHARTHDIEVVVSTLTLVEAMNPQRFQPRWHYVISKIRVEEVTRQLTDQAVALLRSAGLHGHKYAIDAVVAATAMAQHGPTMLLTSDMDDMAKLCDKRIMLIPV
ncbi:DNA-binding protein [Kitasatospora sp. NPDC058218]|uniref:DNA-binding protein n=1 Tax=Kitasatospora sp. NPDC058218 TaxID=3346385 RepID=UPI0036D96F8D